MLATGGLTIVVAGVTWLAASPAAIVVSPNGRLQMRVFTAGQGAIPPDYRAGVRFVLYNPEGLPLFRSTLVAEAPLADGWSVIWQDAHAVTIRAGRLSWFSMQLTEVAGIRVQVEVAARPDDEAACIGQALAHAIDSVVCFDALLAKVPLPPR